MIKLEGKNLSKEKLKVGRKMVKELEDQGYSNMAILYFLGEKYGVSGTYEGDDFVITLF